MGKCIKCGINFIGTAANPPSDGLCKYCEIDQLKAEVADLRSKNRAWALGIEQSNTDIVDMQRDEFKRIIALLRPPQDELTIDEIVGICERGIACIEQTVPVLVQRDRMESALYRVLEWCEQDSPNFEIDAESIRSVLQNAEIRRTDTPLKP